MEVLSFLFIPNRYDALRSKRDSARGGNLT